MSGTWPQLDVQDFTLRSRHYLNELIAKFYQDAELWRYMSQSAREIAQRGSAVRRILDAATVNATRTVAHNAYRCHHVEYIPASGRTEMLEKIDPLQVGHKTYEGSTPQYWYEDVGNIGLDPLPDGAYNLRLYVSDMPKILLASFTSFTIGAGAGNWTNLGTGTTVGGATLSHSGNLSALTYNSALSLSNGLNVTITFNISGISGSAYASISVIGYGTRIARTNGIHTFNTPWDSANQYPSIYLNGTIVMDDIYIWKEIDISSLTDLSDLPPIWNHTLVLMTLLQALQRDNRSVMSKVLSILTAGEIDYLRSNLIEVIPDSKATRWGER